MDTEDSDNFIFELDPLNLIEQKHLQNILLSENQSFKDAKYL